MPFCLFRKMYARYEMLTCSHIVCHNSFLSGSPVYQIIPSPIFSVVKAQSCISLSVPKIPTDSQQFLGMLGLQGRPLWKLYCIVQACVPTASQFTSLYNSLLLQIMGTEVPLSEELGQQGRAKAEVSLYTKANKLTE